MPNQQRAKKRHREIQSERECEREPGRPKRIGLLVLAQDDHRGRCTCQQLILPEVRLSVSVSLFVRGGEEEAERERRVSLSLHSDWSCLRGEGRQRVAPISARCPAPRSPIPTAKSSVLQLRGAWLHKTQVRAAGGLTSGSNTKLLRNLTPTRSKLKTA